MLHIIRKFMDLPVFAFLLLCFVVSIPHAICAAAEADQPPDLSSDLKKLGLSQLMDIEIISVSKKPEKISQATAAVFVITQEDIRRSGATTVPDLLRMVPGIQVARIGDNIWRISSRGFLGDLSNRIAVLIDGRFTYTGSLQVNDLVLEDIERIEIIRGPGSTVWGTEAMTGIINIITKHARDTQGGLATAAAGNRAEGYGVVRYGGKLQEGVHYRVYAKYHQPGTVDYPMHLRDPQNQQAGFRLDWDASPSDRFMFTGSYYHNLDGYYAVARTGDFRWGPDETFKSRRDYSGAHVMGRWEHSFSASSDMALQIYYDHVDGTTKYYGKDSRQRQDYETDVYDIDFQHRFHCWQRHDVMWGAELKMVDDMFEKTPNWSLDPQSRFEHYYSGFLQDEIEMVPDRLKLTLGSKFEYSSFCQFEAHPSIRLLWTPHPRHTVWLAVSRAVRSNIRMEHDMILQLGSKPRYPLVYLPQRGILEIKSRPGMDAEEIIAYEIGYRVQPCSLGTLDLAAFANSFDNLLTSDTYGTMKRTLWYFTVPLYLDNTMDGRAYGVEATATWQATPAWKLQSSYTYLHFDLDPAWSDSNARTIEKLSPHHQVALRSLIAITRQIEFDTCIYFTDRISGHDLSSYTNLTVRLGWRPLNNLELSLVGANLLENRHTELFNPINNGKKSEIRRSVLGKITWTF